MTMAVAMVVASKLSGCTADAARRAISAFKAKGLEFPFDLDDKDQVLEYIQLRRIHSRINAENFMRAMKNKQTSLDSHSIHRTDVYSVPKENFPDGLPAEIQSSVLSPSEIADLQSIGGVEIDTDNFFIIDCEVERSKLGKMVSTLQFGTSRKTTRNTSSGGAGLAQITNSPTPGSHGADVIALAHRSEVAVVGAAS